jgi:hypothetical protein
MDQKNIHWGEWMIERSRFVGFRNQRELSEAVGCRDEQVSRWHKMSQPPRQMRKGFDRNLAAALKVEPQMLFSGWATANPQGTSFIDQFAIEKIRRRALAVVELLPADQLHEFCRMGELMLRGEPAHAA